MTEITDASLSSRSAMIEQRLRILEMEAAIQRATLAATFAQWEERRALSWAFGAAKLAGGVLAGPTAKWLVTALAMRLIRGVIRV